MNWPYFTVLIVRDIFRVQIDDSSGIVSLGRMTNGTHGFGTCGGTGATGAGPIGFVLSASTAD